MPTTSISMQKRNVGDRFLMSSMIPIHRSTKTYDNRAIKKVLGWVTI